VERWEAVVEQEQTSPKELRSNRISSTDATADTTHIQQTAGT
jgi:hypothetical protein